MSTKIMSTKLTRSVAAAVALTASAMLFAAPEANTRPPRTIEDIMKDCQFMGWTWKRETVMGLPGRTCTSKTADKDGRYWQDRYSLSGSPRGLCYRFSVDTDWVCT
jgi:hypothetical protein